MAKRIKKTEKNNSKSRKIVKKRTKRTYTTLIIAIIIIAAIAYVLYIYKDILFKQQLGEEMVIARVDGEDITLKEVDDVYSRLSDEYKQLITKEDILNDIVSERLLLQEAEKQGITATNEEATEVIDAALIEGAISEEEFKTKLDSLQISREYLNDYYRKQLLISRLLNKTLFKSIDVSDAEINQFYEKNQLSTQNITLGDLSDEIRDLLISEKKKSAYLAYIAQLNSRANISIFFDKPITKIVPFNVFTETSDSVCKEGNKPIIKLYTTTNCKSCKWVRETFDSFAKEQNRQGTVIAYHWELNTGDNTLTEETEDGIPKSELDAFRKYNPKSTVPTFVFGCRYVRIGNAYEDQNDLNAEKLEFESIVSKLNQ